MLKTYIIAFFKHLLRKNNADLIQRILKIRTFVAFNQIKIEEMKRFFLVFAFVFMIAGIASAQKKEAVITVIDSANYDFGNVQEANGPVTHVFKVKNTGETALVITQANTTCGCTTAEHTKEPIAPGKTGEVKVTFKVTGYPGPFNRTIAVSSNGKTGTFILTIKGNVIGKQ